MTFKVGDRVIKKFATKTVIQDRYDYVIRCVLRIKSIKSIRQASDDMLVELEETDGFFNTKCCVMLDELEKYWELVDPTKLKYVFCVIMDQTHGYLSEEGDTIKHSEAKLFDSKKDAIEFFETSSYISDTWRDLIKTDFTDLEECVVEVSDVEEFQNREDTW